MVVDVLDLADLAERGEAEPRRAHVDALFDQLGLRRELAPLLGDVVALGQADNEFTRQLDPTVRADNLLTLLATLLQRRLEGRATLILIEDAHLFHSASWALALALAGLAADHADPAVADHPPGRVAAARPPRAARQARGRVDPAQRAQPRGLRRAARRASSRLPELPDELARRAFEWTHGTPFFIEQVALAFARGRPRAPAGTARRGGRGRGGARRLSGPGLGRGARSSAASSACRRPPARR